jgi:hypothetical protein
MRRGRRDRVVHGAIVLHLLLVGCGSEWRPLDPSVLVASKPATLLLALRENETLLGPGGSIQQMYAEGHSITQASGLKDPSLELGRALAASLAEKYHLQLLVVNEPPLRATPSGHAPPPPPPARPAADLVLEVRTGEWGVFRAPYQLTRYAIGYKVEASLTDGRSRRVLAVGDCNGADPDIRKAAKTSNVAEGSALTAHAPRYEVMLADGGRWLHEEFSEARRRCEDEYRARLFFTAAPSPGAP